MARDVGNVTGKLRRYVARRTIVDCSSLSSTIVTQCSQGSNYANVTLPQGQCNISVQIVIPTSCVVNITGTGSIPTIISGSGRTPHFNVPLGSTLNLNSLTLVDGYSNGDGVSKHPSLALATTANSSHFKPYLRAQFIIRVRLQ